MVPGTDRHGAHGEALRTGRSQLDFAHVPIVDCHASRGEHAIGRSGVAADNDVVGPRFAAAEVGGDRAGRNQIDLLIALAEVGDIADCLQGPRPDPFRLRIGGVETGAEIGQQCAGVAGRPDAVARRSVPADRVNDQAEPGSASSSGGVDDADGGRQRQEQNAGLQERRRVHKDRVQVQVPVLAPALLIIDECGSQGVVPGGQADDGGILAKLGSAQLHFGSHAPIHGKLDPRIDFFERRSAGHDDGAVQTRLGHGQAGGGRTRSGEHDPGGIFVLGHDLAVNGHVFGLKPPQVTTALGRRRQAEVDHGGVGCDGGPPGAAVRVADVIKLLAGHAQEQVVLAIFFRDRALGWNEGERTGAEFVLQFLEGLGGGSVPVNCLAGAAVVEKLAKGAGLDAVAVQD